jgi:epoxyqueuosine reductase
MIRNYQKELDGIIEGLEKEEKIPTLLLHSCCAPCSSYCMEYLAKYFRITIFYYNPNISPEAEYIRRTKEQEELIEKIVSKYPINFVEGKYDTERFYAMAKGLELVPEGGARCFGCYELRLREAATIAKEKGFDYFTTTLSISPHKNAEKLNEIGEALAKEYGVKFLPSNFKKKNGYKRSIELSNEFNLYRQDYCGCVYSKENK